MPHTEKEIERAKSVIKRIQEGNLGSLDAKSIPIYMLHEQFDSKTFLDVAADCNNDEAARCLLEILGEVGTEQVREGYNNPIMIAAKKGHEKVLSVFLQPESLATFKKIQGLVFEEFGKDLVMQARTIKTQRMLLAASAAVKDVLFGALGLGHVDMLEELIKAGADVKAKGLVKAAIRFGNPAVVRMLLENGAVPSDSELQKVVKSDETAMLEVFLENEVERFGDELIVAVKGGNEAVVSMLLATGQQPNRGALMEAVKLRNKAVVSLLLANGAKPSGGELLQAVKGYKAVVEECLAHDAPPSAKEKIKAAKDDTEAIVKMLLAHGARPTEEYDNWEKDELREAVRLRNENIVEMLLANGANADRDSVLLDVLINQTHFTGDPAVHASRMKIVKMLLGKISPLSAKRLLRAAICEEPNLEIVKIVLAHGVRPESFEDKGADLIQQAFTSGTPAILKELLEAGAPVGALSFLKRSKLALRYDVRDEASSKAIIRIYKLNEALKESLAAKKTAEVIQCIETFIEIALVSSSEAVAEYATEILARYPKASVQVLMDQLHVLKEKYAEEKVLNLLEKLGKDSPELNLILGQRDELTDEAKAFARYVQVAADTESADAYYLIGHCFQKGIGTSQDFTKALYYFYIAATQGSTEAYKALPIHGDYGPTNYHACLSLIYQGMLRGVNSEATDGYYDNEYFKAAAELDATAFAFHANNLSSVNGLSDVHKYILLDISHNASSAHPKPENEKFKASISPVAVDKHSDLPTDEKLPSDAVKLKSNKMQLKEIGYEGDVPDEFTDQKGIMTNPVEVTDIDGAPPFICDFEHYLQLRVHPKTQKPLDPPTPQTNLRETIAKWVSFQLEIKKSEGAEVAADKSTRFPPLYIKSGSLQIGGSLHAIPRLEKGGVEEMQSMKLTRGG